MAQGGRPGLRVGPTVHKGFTPSGGDELRYGGTTLCRRRSALLDGHSNCRTGHAVIASQLALVLARRALTTRSQPDSYEWDDAMLAMTAHLLGVLTPAVIPVAQETTTRRRTSLCPIAYHPSENLNET